VQFGPTRVQLQMYLLFAVTLAVSIEAVPRRLRVDRRAPGLIFAIAAVAATIAVVNSSLLSSTVERNSQLVSYYSDRGDQVSRIPTPPDLVAGQWLATNDPKNEVIQTDWDGQYVMYALGYADKRGFIPSIDPVTTDEHAWVLATHTNVLDGIARGGTYAETGVFNFPGAYLTATRPVLYATSTDVVYGSDRVAFERRHVRRTSGSHSHG
jgi:hypothetical protein